MKKFLILLVLVLVVPRSQRLYTVISRFGGSKDHCYDLKTYCTTSRNDSAPQAHANSFAFG